MLFIFHCSLETISARLQAKIEECDELQKEVQRHKATAASAIAAKEHEAKR